MQPSDKLTPIPNVMYARKHFVLDDEYNPGDKFDATGWPARRVRQLWSQRKIGTAEEFQQDQDRYAARCDAEKAAKRSAVHAEIAAMPTLIEGGEQLVMQDQEPEGQTAEDFDL